MLVCDYIVEFLISKGVKDIFGYPGGMVTYFMNALDTHSNQISNHICYHEQAASFAACGYAQTSGKLGVCYATSGPGATNLMTGIANAYFDSIPLLAITGQVNINEQKGELNVRQKGFQEFDVCSAVKDMTKYTLAVKNAEEIPEILERAYRIAFEGRKGPVVLDIPMNIFRTDIADTTVRDMEIVSQPTNEVLNTAEIVDLLKTSKKPVIIAGNGIQQSDTLKEFRLLVEKLQIPVITSMIAIDLLPSEIEYNFGFGGIYGNRCANILLSQCDLILSLGARLDCRFVGSDVKAFAPNAKLIRIDIDKNELENKIHEDEIDVAIDLKVFFADMLAYIETLRFDYSSWLNAASRVKTKLSAIDNEEGNSVISSLSKYISDNAIITTDVGQNQVWVSQSFHVKSNQRVLYSGGHGSMGYSLPAAIGAYYGTGMKRPIVSINGDGGFQMNIQELQTVKDNKIPLKIFILNNSSLGMIRHFQEMYFDSNYTLTTVGKGYSVPNFHRIAEAYGLKAVSIKSSEDFNCLAEDLASEEAVVFSVDLSNCTYVYPKLVFGKPTYDQDPPLSEEILKDVLEEINI